MRRTRPGDEEWELELPVAMIDVTFLLLVFFMCTAQFRTLDRKLDAHLPKDSSCRGIGGEVTPEVWVRITRSDILAGRKRCDDLNHLARVLAETKQATQNLRVVLDAGDDVPFHLVLGSLDACKRARIDRVRFAAPTGPGS